MKTLEDNLRIICEDLALDLTHKWDKDKAMVLNNLCEYILPKKQRIGHEVGVSEERDFLIKDYGSQKNGSLKDIDAE